MFALDATKGYQTSSYTAPFAQVGAPSEAAFPDVAPTFVLDSETHATLTDKRGADVQSSDCAYININKAI
ncbi:hypothetical protein [Bernardetia litoralis]|uniref:hypothetical protein n=1 Tax=Bernardetia litoralis TaxID=999 RepID=UPI0002FEC09E|nr:hypothetical protein [Bernardetia litoralis]